MNNLKSISFLFFLTTLFFSVNGITVIRIKKKPKNDLIARKDFKFYLDSLEKLVDFYKRHEVYVNLSPAFGLFMVDVNLRNHLQHQAYDIPVKIRSRLEILLLKIDKLSNYFWHKVQQIKEKEKYSKEIKISELYYNKTTWSRVPDKFNKDLMKHRNTYDQAELKEMYGEWEDYLNDLKNSTRLDSCLDVLAGNLPSKSPEQCRIPSHCIIRAGNGTEVGFSVADWVFVLITARFSRKCFVFSEKADKHELDEFCVKYFHEVEYIAGNDFKLPVVASHHCAVCGILGHAQFYKKFWLKKLTQFQTSEGCYSDLVQAEKFEESKTVEAKDDEWIISNKTTIKNGECNASFSSISLLTLSNALRYIIETCY